MRRVTIIQSEFLVVAEPEVLVTTVLGSCIAVCLVDRAARVGGINHFLLAAPVCGSRESGAALQRYGIHAMEVLINALLAAGAQRPRLVAHLYGGADIIAGLGRIGTSNTDFAVDFLRVEGIPVRHADTGGRLARRVEFVPFDGRSRCRLADPDDMQFPSPAPATASLAPSGALELF